MANVTLKTNGTGGYSEGVTAAAELATMANYFFIHSATPEGAIAAAIGSICINTAGGADTTLYTKETGAGTNTGWSAMAGV
jgi:hypothetical protein